MNIIIAYDKIMKQLYILFIFMGLLYPAMQSYAQSSFNYLRTTSAISDDGTGRISTSVL